MTLLITAIISLAIGLKLPDVDLAPLFWRHRSAWTHGPLWAIALPMIPLPSWAMYATIAALIGVTIHLARDVFPKAWTGAALINFAPLKPRFGPSLSFLYILGSCIYTAFTVWRLFAG